jgi:hypothetical protein
VHRRRLACLDACHEAFAIVAGAVFIEESVSPAALESQDAALMAQLACQGCDAQHRRSRCRFTRMVSAPAGSHVEGLHARGAGSQDKTLWLRVGFFLGSGQGRVEGSIHGTLSTSRASACMHVRRKSVLGILSKWIPLLLQDLAFQTASVALY